ncbi:LytTR family transcriptional regulator DNA-binding domain-containing protein [Paenibacillus sp. R14(2021)]|uniref:LytTR family transcriptional regulator DNA-binding domain-containing protein n=1 Tax=Paenibacillus sp. R14(2021) TaxID=2859228 RepID=UPI001C6135E7|nr:LytTR family transcriptional regulator DNA-binding domain-containing protein [Paenibacillus sp. R14(2021)]
MLLLLNKKGEPVWIPVDTICLISPTAKGPEFLAKDGKVYRYPITMGQLDRVFGSYGFQRLDRNALVNMNAAERYDPIQRKVYFSGADVEQEELYATVSAANAAKAQHLTVRECESAKTSYAAA